MFEQIYKLSKIRIPVQFWSCSKIPVQFYINWNVHYIDFMRMHNFGNLLYEEKIKRNITGFSTIENMFEYKLSLISSRVWISSPWKLKKFLRKVETISHFAMRFFLNFVCTICLKKIYREYKLSLISSRVWISSRGIKWSGESFRFIADFTDQEAKNMRHFSRQNCGVSL